MALEGSLEVLRLPEILQMIALQRKTGILTVQGEQDIIAISFLHGDVVAADALNQTVEEGLGQVLAGQGLVAPADFAAVSAEHQTGGGRLVDLLQQRKYITRVQLLEALRVQTYNLLYQILDWQQGTFKFYGGEEVAFEEGFKPISVEELLIRALGDSDPSDHTVPELALAYEAIPPSKPIHVIDPDASGVHPSDASVLWLRPEEKGLLDALDGQRTAAVLALDTGLGDYKVLYALYRLQRQGLARPARSAARPASVPTERAAASPNVASGVPAAIAAAVGRTVQVPPLVPIREPVTQRQAAGHATPRPAGSTPVVPPEPGRRQSGPRPTAVARDVRTEEVLASLSVVPGRILALLLAAALGAGLVLVPRRFLLPFPGQSTARAAAESRARMARFIKLDRGTRTFFLLEGRYPDDLNRLVDVGLASPSDVRSDNGRPFAYSTDGLTYTLQPIAHGEAIADQGTSQGIAGDFLLDPYFLKNKKKDESQPLVLLD